LTPLENYERFPIVIIPLVGCSKLNQLDRTEILFPGTVYHFETEGLEVNMRFLLVPLADKSQLITLEAPEAEFDAFTAEVDRLLQTIRWKEKTAHFCSQVIDRKSFHLPSIWMLTDPGFPV
jgi:hypothetical protein